MTTTTDTTYNGYTNYETWAVSLWISNEESSATYWAGVATSRYALAGMSNRPAHFTQSEDARYGLAEILKEELTGGAPDLGASLYADLLGAALDEVDWADIADNLLADSDGYEPLT